MIVLKKCRKCLVQKPLDDFPKHGKKGLRPDCKPCYSIGRRHQPSVINQRYKKFGITKEQHDQMFESQGGKCAICGRMDTLGIDHSHDTMQIRGILCTPCNQALGLFRDKVYLLENAITYLKTKDEKYVR